MCIFSSELCKFPQGSLDASVSGPVNRKYYIYFNPDFIFWILFSHKIHLSRQGLISWREKMKCVLCLSLGWIVRTRNKWGSVCKMSGMNNNRCNKMKPFMNVLANRCGHILPITSIFWTNQFLPPENWTEFFLHHTFLPFIIKAKWNLHGAFKARCSDIKYLTLSWCHAACYRFHWYGLHLRKYRWII